ncbi:hypothetical protein D3273_25335 [Lichenibacterium minor]|uniref:Uncharacterized protein n=1 Tax=Lichenibacterium minor TaxID=2316528 RepID=A0A4Q2U2T1_9HYPH|nr:hypothetical protein [Lichenibacterium minor]RYC29191.1 hypothetical protein D3273_25335 [Lichenibacterium minor]
MAAEARTAPRRRVDLLQWEHHHGRISHLTLAAGRGLEEAFALLHRSGASTWGERVDAPRGGDGEPVSRPPAPFLVRGAR